MISTIFSVAAILSALSALFLGLYLVYVRLSQHLYTEKRFNFVALWTSFSLMNLLLLHISNFPAWDIIFLWSGVSSPSPGLMEKILATIIVGYFIHRISNWAQSWSGLRTKEGHEALSRESNPSFVPFFIKDGISETWRIIHLRPPQPSDELGRSKPDSLRLPKADRYLAIS